MYHNLSNSEMVNLLLLIFVLLYTTTLIQMLIILVAICKILQIILHDINQHLFYLLVNIIIFGIMKLGVTGY